MVIRNTAATLAGQLLYPLLALVLVPFYIRHLGLEGYGLVGLLALFVSLLGVFGRGLGAGLVREIGRRAGAGDAATVRRLVRSVEVAYWAIAVAILAALAALAIMVGPAWLRPERLPDSTVTTCLILLAVRIAVAFPHSVYQAVFIGTERQVLGSGLNAALALTSASANVAAVLVFGSVVAFYAAEILTAAAFLLIFRTAAFRILPGGPARFDGREVRRLASISLALMWTSGIGLLLSNLDRLVVTTLVPVASLAVFTVAVMGARLITLVGGPFLQATYPRMCRTARDGTPAEQARDLLRNAAVMNVVVAGVGLPLMAFAPEILDVWIGRPDVVAAAAPVMSIYAGGAALIAMASVLYQWQTAAGRTSIAVTFNGAALLVFPVGLWLLVGRAGLAGAAAAWAGYGAAAWLTNVLATFRAGALTTRAGRSYLAMTVLALGPAVLAIAGGRLAASAWLDGHLAGRVACGAAAAAVASLVAFAAGRSWILDPGRRGSDAGATIPRSGVPGAAEAGSASRVPRG